MLELEEEDRIDFTELLEMISNLRKPSKILSSYMSTSNNSNQEYCRNNKSPIRRKTSTLYRNDVSPFRGANLM
jgi:hypothetical protein